jgi:heat shock protein HtpX
MVSNWREIAKSNQKKTFAVILSFVSVYLVLGALVVLVLYPRTYSIEDIPSILLKEESQFILSIFLAFSGIAVLLSVFFGAKFSLSGTDAIRVTAETSDPEMRRLYHVIEEMKVSSSLRFMPKIYMINAPYMNAFASGWNEKSSIVAITKPLLQALNREELQAVMAHELAHIKNKDTQVMTIVSVLSAISILVIDTMFRGALYGSGRRGRSRNQRTGGILLIIVMVLRIVLPILTAFLVMYVSRSREMLADAGSTQMTRNPEALARALLKIHTYHQSANTKDAYAQTENNSMRSLAYMYDPNSLKKVDRWDVNAYFATHPTIQERLQALGMQHLLVE